MLQFFIDFRIFHRPGCCRDRDLMSLVLSRGSFGGSIILLRTLVRLGVRRFYERMAKELINSIFILPIVGLPAFIDEFPALLGQRHYWPLGHLLGYFLHVLVGLLLYDRGALVIRLLLIILDPSPPAMGRMVVDAVTALDSPV